LKEVTCIHWLNLQFPRRSWV